MLNKKRAVEQFIITLKYEMEKSYKLANYENAMAAISCAAQILYGYNQFYTDNELEQYIEMIAQKLKCNYQEELEHYQKNEKTVLFYDGFGLDTRGVAKMYLNALKANEYEIIYVIPETAKGKMPDTAELTKNANISWVYLSEDKSYQLWVQELLNTIFLYRPHTMFFYTTPYDVSGAVAFAVLEGKATRYLIDLTDHAFWLGIRSNDFFCGSREMSASNQHYERGISKEKCIKLGVNLIVDECVSHLGLPFDVENTRYVFSGGSLYKTLGDEENTYYRIVDHILKHHEDIKFLYAGTGDRVLMDKVIAKYPNRIFLINERKDFYFLIKNCTLYLNTYPMFGGMMMKYSAYAGRIPVTLRHDADSDGLLINQKKANIEYNTYEELINDVDLLLTDDEYLKKREKLLDDTVIKEERFIKNVKMTIENQTTDYEHEFVRIDTQQFRKEFYERFNFEQEKQQLVKWINKSLILKMPCMYKTIFAKIYKKCINKWNGWKIKW